MAEGLTVWLVWSIEWNEDGDWEPIPDSLSVDSIWATQGEAQVRVDAIEGKRDDNRGWIGYRSWAEARILGETGGKIHAEIG